MIYLICFIGSAVLAYFADKTREKKKFWLFSALSILLPVLVAGLRDYSIGVDTISYYTMERFWGGAIEAESLGAYMKYYLSLGYGEPLFAFLCGLIAQVFGNYSVFLLVVHGIIISCVYIGARRFRREANPAFVLLLFYLVFYSHSLNIMRQYIAMSIVFAALADVPQRKYIRYGIAVIFAALFHKAALIGVGSLLIHWFINCDWEQVLIKASGKWIRIKAFLERLDIYIGKPAEEMKPLQENEFRMPVLHRIQSRVLRRQLFLFAGLLLLVLLFNPLCRLAIHMGVLHDKYMFYLDMSRAEHTTLITLFLLVEMTALILFFKYLRRSSQQFDFFFTNSGAYLILHQLSLFLVYGKRVAALFSLTNLVTIAMLPRMYKDKQRRILVYAAVLVVVLFYWFYTYILRNASDTYPYVFVFF